LPALFRLAARVGPESLIDTAVMLLAPDLSVFQQMVQQLAMGAFSERVMSARQCDGEGIHCFPPVPSIFLLYRRGVLRG